LADRTLVVALERDLHRPFAQEELVLAGRQHLVLALPGDVDEELLAFERDGELVALEIVAAGEFSERRGIDRSIDREHAVVLARSKRSRETRNPIGAGRHPNARSL